MNSADNIVIGDMRLLMLTAHISIITGHRAIVIITRNDSCYIRMNLLLITNKLQTL